MNHSPPMFNVIVFFVLFCFSLGPLKHSDMLGFNTIEIHMKIEFTSQMREMLLFLSINTAAVTTCANQQLN